MNLLTAGTLENLCSRCKSSAFVQGYILFFNIESFDGFVKQMNTFASRYVFGITRVDVSECDATFRFRDGGRLHVFLTTGAQETGDKVSFASWNSRKERKDFASFTVNSDLCLYDAYNYAPDFSDYEPADNCQSDISIASLFDNKGG